MRLPALEPSHPVNLAALRISVAAVLLSSPETYAAERIAALPEVLRAPPEGLRFAASVVPVTPELARVLYSVLVAAACTSLVGLFTRASLAVVSVAGLYVLGVYQLTGSVTHDMHLLWFAALLAAGPSGESLSVDAWLARRRGAPRPRASVEAAVPLFFFRVLLGLVYFFPGFWKLRESGLAWIFSDNLRYQMYWKWYESGRLPALRIDHYGGLVQAGALGVVVFELAFLPLVLFRRTRLVAAAAGLAFHLLTDALLFIPFVSLWACYTAIVDWEPFARALSPAQPTHDAGHPHTPSRPPRGAAALGIALTAAVLVQGARNAVQAWPFGCYPTFQALAGPTIPDVALEAVAADGAPHMLPDGRGGGGRARTPEEWATAWRLGGLYGDAPTPERLRAYVEGARARPEIHAALRGAHTVRVYLGWYSVVPEHAGRAPVSARLLGEVRL